MRAITFNGFGGVEVLTVSEIPPPRPGPEQMLVRVGAAALNRADTMQRRGEFSAPPGESDIPGVEIAGRIEALGARVTDWRVGQRVFGLVDGGGYAELCLIDQKMALPVPEEWSWVEAAAVPEVFYTANESLFELADLKRGESVLIHAGGSGVGTACIQLAHRAGARVFITAGSRHKIERALALGASAGVSYKTHDFAEEIQRLTDGEGVDVIVDCLGADSLARNLAILKPAGRLIEIGLMTGSRCEIDLELVVLKRLQIKGTVMRRRPLADKRAIARRFRERWWPRFLDTTLQPVVDSVYSLEQVAEAHQAMEERRNFGKIVLTLES